MRLRAIAILLPALLVPAAPVGAAVAASDSALLARVGGSYRTMKTYLFAGAVDISLRAAKGGQQSQQADFLIAVGEGGRLRDQVESPVVGSLFVSDGKETWVYNPALSQWMRKPGRASEVLATLGMRGIAGSFVQRLAFIDAGVRSVQRLPDESLTVGGRLRPCHVLEVTYPPSTDNPKIREGGRRYWIDKGEKLVLKQRSVARAEAAAELGGEIEQVETVTFTRVERSPVFADSLWTFRPPAGAREVARFEAPGAGASPMDGKAAFDFALKDLAGKSHTLKSLRGKVVLLDFWATWCGPCRITMPRIAKIHDAYKTKGVEVLSINVGEPIAKARDYMKRNGYTFTTLLDGDRKVATDYKVNGIPTLVVVDREGTISSYLVGAHSEETLKNALAKAGVE
jgi:thiol-disulfide isomerase/thioredoxin